MLAYTNRSWEARLFDQQRKEQGFKSQADLDAWFAYYDHTCACAECQKPGKGMYLSDNSYQPSRNTCEIGQQLYKAWRD
jgi:hypothetical protein